MPVLVPREGVYLRQGVAIRLEVEGDEQPTVRVPPTARDRFVFSEPRWTQDRWALTLLYVPERTGKQWIPAVEVRTGETVVKTRPAVVEVKPVPTPGRPESFRGGVGAVEASATVEPARVTVGDHFVYRIDLRGPGAIGTTSPVGPKALAGDSLSVVEGPSVKREAEPPGASFSWTVRAMRAGTVRIPASIFSCFEPGSKRFLTSVVPGVEVEVADAPGLDARQVLREARGPGRAARPSRGWGLVVAGVVLVLVVGGFGLARLRNRRVRPWKIAREEVRRIGKASGEEQVARAVLEGLGRYLSAALEGDRGPVTPPEAVEGIRKATGREGLADQAGRLVSRCDRALYGSAGPGEGLLRDDAVRFFRDLARGPSAGDVGGGKMVVHRQAAKQLAAMTGARDAVSGRLGGELYDAGKLSRLESYLARRGVTLRVGEGFLPPGTSGGFLSKADGTAELILRGDPTGYEVWHEIGHFRHWTRIGSAAYRALPRWSRANPVQDIPEQYVFDMLERGRHWQLLNDAQRQHAVEYIFSRGGIR